MTNNPPRSTAEFLFHHHGDGAQDGAQGQGPGIPHKDLGRVGVEPQKSHAGTGQDAADDRDFSGGCDMADMQVLGNLDMAGHIGKNM